MFRKFLSTLSLGTLLFAANLAVLPACRPTYPRCNNDEQCHEKGEVCVNGQCQECREAAQCELRYPNEKRVCADGRCEAKLECHLDSDCRSIGVDLVCRNNKCAPECTQNGDCGTGRRCNAQKCVAECGRDADCPADQSCQGGACMAGGSPQSQLPAQCQPRGGVPGEVVHIDTVHFEFNQYDLTADTREALSQATACLKEAPANLHIVAEGHCDDRGTQEYNLALGERRAQAVVKYLKTLGIEADRLTTRSKGENEPLCNDASDVCYSQNRRVQFLQQVSGR